MAEPRTTKHYRDNTRAEIETARLHVTALDVINGHPLPVRGPDGEIVRYEQPDTKDRVALLSKMIGKVLLDLAAMKIDTELTGPGGQPITVLAPFQLPGSARTGQDEPPAVEKQEVLPPEPGPEPEPTTAPVDVPEKRRRHRGRSEPASASEKARKRSAGRKRAEPAPAPERKPEKRRRRRGLFDD